MTLDLRSELKQRKPFVSLEQQAHLNIVRTGNLLTDSFEQLLKPHGITGTQYNVLRILRGAEPNGLGRNEVRERLLSRMPDATRLLDRLEDAGLATRSRGEGDRRMVTTRITPEGRRLVDGLDEVVEDEYQRRLAPLSEKQTRKLIKLLRRIQDWKARPPHSVSDPSASLVSAATP